MISVVIPLYNKELIIERSLQSVLSQNFDDFEVVVVNDGSTDRSAEIVKSINDSRITLVEQENGGPSRARNTGVKHAKGDWILFLDADDEMLPGALNHFSILILEHPQMFFFACNYNTSYSNYEKASLDDDIVVDNPFKAHFHDLILPRTGSAVYSRELVFSCMFDESIRRYEDLDGLFRMYAKTKVHVSPMTVLKVNMEYSSASRARKSIKEDFLGHVDMRGKCFWERMCLYKLFIEERTLYPEETRQLYPDLYKRYDMFFLYKLVGWIKKYPFVWNLYLRVIGLSQFAK